MSEFVKLHSLFTGLLTF